MTDFLHERSKISLAGLALIAGCYNPRTNPVPDPVTMRVSERYVDVSVGGQKRNCLLKLFYSKDSAGAFRTEPDSIVLKSLSDCR